MYIPIAVQAQPTINAAIAAVLREMTPAVQGIDYEVAQDWSGQWAIFFRVLLSDEVSKPPHLRGVVRQIVSRVSEKIDIPGLGLFPYFDFERQSEQAKELARA
jgi:hypothetical protein